MKFLDVLGSTVSDALDYVLERNRTQAQVNRLRLVMRNEAKLMDKSYNELGKYYYEHLRQTADTDNEKLCQTIDHSKARMKKAQKRYHQIVEEQIQNISASAMDDDSDDITVCCSYDEPQNNKAKSAE